MSRKDLRYANVFRLRFNPLRRLEKIKNPKLKSVIDAFKKNCFRLDSLLRMPPGIVIGASKVQWCADRAFSAVYGRVHSPGEPANYSDKVAVDAAFKTAWDEITKWEKSMPNRAAQQLHLGHHNLSKFMEDAPIIREGIEVVLTASILSTWTAFETLAGDLWETALNCYPSRLASLRGSENRISNLSRTGKRNTHQPNEPDQKLSLKEIAEITDGSFDISQMMGTVLREQFPFQTLRGIREAYSRAFHDSPRVDAVLAKRCIDALASVRNLIVHKAGMTDEKYRLDYKDFPGLPRPNKTKPISGIY